MRPAECTIYTCARCNGYRASCMLVLKAPALGATFPSRGAHNKS